MLELSGRTSPGGGLSQPAEGTDVSVLALLCIGIADASVLALPAWLAGLGLCIGGADGLGPCIFVPLNCEKGLQAFLNQGPCIFVPLNCERVSQAFLNHLLFCIGMTDASVLALPAWPAGPGLCFGNADALGPCIVVSLNGEKGLQAFLNHLLLLGSKSPLAPCAHSVCIFLQRRFPGPLMCCSQIVIFANCFLQNAQVPGEGGGGARSSLNDVQRRVPIAMSHLFLK